MDIKSPKWVSRFMKIAECVSQWSKDPSTKIGAVIVSRDGRILATGYNGFPEQFEDLEEFYYDKEFKYSNIIHAEANAIYNALKHCVDVKGSSIFIWGLAPCCDCSKMLAQCGIKNVYFKSIKTDQRWIQSFEKSKIIFNFSGIEWFEYTQVESDKSK